ncbi:MerR family transcriptional regulator [Paenibacillus sp. NPDC093718]|uniref:MerR family transcriptional regulator n=1 Tax=Paenibacillus sp. NPDC093718 TaxID=3390601 RepID=UPI003D04B7BA
MEKGKWITITELTEQFDIPQPTIRRYIERHGHHLLTKKHHKSYLISSESLPIVIQIREAYARGMNGEQVEEVLAANRVPTYINVDDHEDGQALTINLHEAIQVMQEGFRQLQQDRSRLERLETMMGQIEMAATALPDPAQQRAEYVTNHLTEKRIERQLQREAMEQWMAKPESERMKKAGLFKKIEDVNARDRFILDYIDDRYEQRIKEAYDTDLT